MDQSLKIASTKAWKRFWSPVILTLPCATASLTGTCFVPTAMKSSSFRLITTSGEAALPSETDSPFRSTTGSDVVDLKGLSVSDGKAASPDVVINLKDEDFIAVGTKQVPVKDAVAQGKVKMTGDQNLFQALVDAI
uniref:Uncharacterized protein n=1 Tax=Anopheles albimanus TaxID=7167 RepID=A0A182FAT5_ANOAL